MRRGWLACLITVLPLAAAPTGESLFLAQCAVCHGERGEGCHRTFGPELAGIGGRRSAAHLRTSLTDPGADVPAGFVMFEVMTMDGRKVTGARVNEDTFSLQVREVGGAVRSFWKSELKEVKKQAGRSPMPSYRGVLSESELDDLTAFLAGWM
jgi:cytochrome c oxidase cbb3-type subunit 3